MDELSDQSLSPDFVRPSRPSKWVPGQIIQGRYKVVRELGRGGMGIVLEVENVLIKTTCALKLIECATSSPLAVRRLQREARLLSELDHPSIVKALDFGLLEDDTPYVLMELIHGRTLSDFLKNRRPLTEDEAKRLFVPVLEALQYAHDAHVVHRDLKPTNIMLVESASGPMQVKLLDFGLALPSELTVEALTRDGSVMGTPLYMSPEQASGEEMTKRSDIYSLGCVIFEALTGAPPFAGRTQLETLMMQKSTPAPTLSEASMGGSFSRRMEATIKKMLAKDPSDRFHSCAGVIEALKGSEANSSQQGTTLSKSRIPKVVWISVPIVCVLATIGFQLIRQPDSKSSPTSQKPLTASFESVPKFEVEPTTSSSNEVLLPNRNAMGDDNVKADGGDIIIKETPTTLEFQLINTTAAKLGDLKWVDGGRGRFKYALVPGKKLIAPRNEDLWFEPGFETLRNPLLLSKFEKAKLAGIILKPSDGEGTFLQSSINESLKLIPDTVHSLVVNKIELSQKDIKAISKLDNLTFLNIKQSSLDPSAAADMSTLFKSLRLKTFALTYVKETRREDVKEALRTVGTSDVAVLGLTGTPIDEEICQSISHLHNLRVMNLIGSFRHCRMDVALTNMGSLPRLEALFASLSDVTDEAVEYLNKLKKFKRLYVYYKPDDPSSPQTAPTIAATTAKHFVRLAHFQIIPLDTADAGFEPWKEHFKF